MLHQQRVEAAREVGDAALTYHVAVLGPRRKERVLSAAGVCLNVQCHTMTNQYGMVHTCDVMG